MGLLIDYLRYKDLFAKAAPDYNNKIFNKNKSTMLYKFVEKFFFLEGSELFLCGSNIVAF